jgi:hypothetical protein
MVAVRSVGMYLRWSRGGVNSKPSCTSRSFSKQGRGREGYRFKTRDGDNGDRYLERRQQAGKRERPL